jgi:hypothetical protein
VPFIESLESNNSIEEFALLGDRLQKNQVDKVPWLEFPYRPAVSFTIAHGADVMLLKYFVIEKNVRASCLHTNDPVYQDSCVEFFIAFENDDHYYNFEFNCLGFCLSAYGKNRYDRTLQAEDVVKLIATHTEMTTRNGRGVQCATWRLTVAIPISVFSFHTFTSLSGMDCRANFYKCGDRLPEPHYLAWNNLVAPAPDFHLPQYFGEMKFL